MAREPVDGHEDLGGSQEFGPWYDTQTGQQFARLPMDPRAFQRYARRGWMPGTPPVELKAKWEAGEADRAAANAAEVARFSTTEEGKKIVDEAKGDQSTGASTEKVADAVIDKLIKLGIIKVPVENEINQETEAAADLEEAGNQLKLL
ncbi:hypothetical protein LCGC14_1853650 [marine sediment metagenome]|uniref:Uncharacterized protein n=1 Tax=marine sediment metagenome TaxID=412755 RepID=A0A0F9GXV9_9ZZZZ